MKRWLGPSLLRRTLFALLAAMVLVWVVLSLKDFRAFKEDVRSRESFKTIAQATLASLQGFDAGQAHWAMKAADRQYNELRRKAEAQAQGSLLFQLNAADRALVYQSEGGTPPADGDATDPSRAIEYRGMPYWPMVQRNERWRLAVWVPVMTDATAMGLIGKDILSYLLWALPFVMLPMGLAVWLGLRPLRTLSRQIALRPQEDLSPLQEPTGYAELMPLVEAANVLLDRSRQQRELEQAFVQDAAHELKTPLAVVAAQAHVLAAAPDPEQRALALKALEQGVDRASHQVNQLLVLAALDHAAPRPAAVVDLVELVREVLIELEPLACQKGIHLALQSPDRLPDRLDAGALRLVLVNLVRNAIQHGAVGGEVETQLSRTHRKLCLAVCDDGPGIAPAERERVFDRFYRTESTETSGSGLGLSIVKRAARRMNATVRVSDGPNGQGALMQLTWIASPDLT